MLLLLMRGIITGKKFMANCSHHLLDIMILAITLTLGCNNNDVPHRGNV